MSVTKPESFSGWNTKIPVLPRGWYRKSVPNDDVWRTACTHLNRGKERSSPASGTASRPRQPCGSPDIPAAHSWRAGTGSGRRAEEGSRTAASGNALWSRRGPRPGTASPMGGATPSPGASLDAPSARQSPPSGPAGMHPAREGRRSPGCSTRPRRPLPSGPWHLGHRPPGRSPTWQDARDPRPAGGSASCSGRRPRCPETAPASLRGRGEGRLRPRLLMFTGK